jgi:predicted secreted hydrolase
MDREFGTWTPTENQKGWDWFSIQFENGTELMCYQLRNETGGVSSFSSGTFVDKDGNSTFLSNEDFKIEPTGFWKSRKTDATYPSGWNLSVPKFDLNLKVMPVIENQELDTRGTTMIVYWEGACEVRSEDKANNGKAYVELVGYDRSHDAPNLAYFLMGNQFSN